MHTMNVGKPLSLLLVLAFAGCGGRSGASPDATPATAKAVLQGIAQSGEPLGKEREDLEKAFQNLKSSDAAKGEKLLQQLQELSSLNRAPEIRAKAAAMASQL